MAATGNEFLFLGRAGGSAGASGRGGLARSGGRQSLDADELDFKDKHGGGRDGALALDAVTELGRDEEFPLCADLHELQGLDPTGDDSGDGERDGLAALHGAVEDGAVHQGAVVVDLHGLAGRGRGAGARAEHLVL